MPIKLQDGKPTFVEPTKIEKAREQRIVKANALIQKTRYSLNAQQQKIILYLISKIKPDDDELKEYVFDLKEFSEVCGITDNGKNYQNFKDSIKGLHDKSFWIETDTKDMLLSWVERVEINKGETTVSLRLDDRLKPYLLHLQEQFTTYEIPFILTMSSKYAIRLYEILKSYAYIGTLTMTIDDIKETLQTAEYKDYKNFRVNVIDIACREINEKSDINVSYEPHRTNRKITSLTFIITKKDILQSLQTYNDNINVLNGGR